MHHILETESQNGIVGTRLTKRETVKVVDAITGAALPWTASYYELQLKAIRVVEQFVTCGAGVAPPYDDLGFFLPGQVAKC